MKKIKRIDCKIIRIDGVSVELLSKIHKQRIKDFLEYNGARLLSYTATKDGNLMIYYTKNTIKDSKTKVFR